MSVSRPRAAASCRRAGGPSRPWCRRRAPPPTSGGVRLPPFSGEGGIQIISSPPRSEPHNGGAGEGVSTNLLSATRGLHVRTSPGQYITRSAESIYGVMFVGVVLRFGNCRRRARPHTLIQYRASQGEQRTSLLGGARVTPDGTTLLQPAATRTTDDARGRPTRRECAVDLQSRDAAGGGIRSHPVPSIVDRPSVAPPAREAIPPSTSPPSISRKPALISGLDGTGGEPLFAGAAYAPTTMPPRSHSLLPGLGALTASTPPRHGRPRA